jgi:hypothetical protein
MDSRRLANQNEAAGIGNRHPVSNSLTADRHLVEEAKRIGARAHLANKCCWPSCHLRRRKCRAPIITGARTTERRSWERDSSRASSARFQPARLWLDPWALLRDVHQTLMPRADIRTMMNVTETLRWHRDSRARRRPICGAGSIRQVAPSPASTAFYEILGFNMVLGEQAPFQIGLVLGEDDLVRGHFCVVF